MVLDKDNHHSHDNTKDESRTNAYPSVANPTNKTDSEADYRAKADAQRKNFFSWLRFIALWLVIGLLISQFVLQRNTVFGDSMLPTLYSRDELLVEKISRHFGGIARGDIVTCRSYLSHQGPDTYIVKRVIGLPHETVEIREGHVYIDGELLPEDYLAENVVTRPIVDDFRKVKLAADEYYVLGDNRSQSQDSRYFGPVNKKDIMGEVLIRFYPFSRFGRP